MRLWWRLRVLLVLRERGRWLKVRRGVMVVYWRVGV